MVDPAWHTKPQASSFRSAIFYFIRIALLAGLCAGVAHTGYALYSKNSLAKQLAQVLPNSEIKSGRLIPAMPVPALVNTERLSTALTMLFMINGFEALPDSFVVVDTTGTIRVGDRSTVRLLLTADKLIVNPGTNYAMSIPYSRFIPLSETLTFNPQKLQNLLLRHRVDLLFHFVVLGLMINFFSLCGTMFFLAVTGFILSMRSKISFGRYMVISLYSITPAAVGTIVVAVSGTHFYWMWQILLIVSTIVMYRAVLAIALSQKPPVNG